MTPKRIPFRQLRYHLVIYLFVLPAVLLIALFQYYPALSGVYHSFFRWNGADIKEFVGFQNYALLANTSDFWRSFRVAAIIGFWNVLKMAPAIAVAICIHRVRSERMQWVYRFAMVAPMVIPPLIAVLIWRSFFFEATNGYLNRFIEASGLVWILPTIDRWLGLGNIFQPGIQPAWLGDGRLLLFACTVWGFPWVGSFAVLIYLAKLQAIPKELYEAGDIDGTGWWTKCIAIELPLIMGSVGLQLVFVIIGTLKDAGTILALAGMEGGPGGVVTVPALFSLRKAFIEQQYGAACAVGIVLTLVVFALTKLFGQLGSWDALPRSQKGLMRLSGFTLAALIYVFLQSPLIALVVLAASIPWPLFIAPLLRGCRRLVEALRRAPKPPRSPGLIYGTALRTAKHGWVLLVLALAYLPIYLMIIVSFKSNTQFYNDPASLSLPLHPENWSAAWTAIIPSLANSVFTTVSSTVLTLLLALAGAYFFARVEVPGSTLLWNGLLLLLMLPDIANLLPLFNLLVKLNLTNTLFALVIVGTSTGLVFSIIWLRNFIADLPLDLFEAAEIDGASHLRQMFTVVLPLSGPILGVIGVMHALSQWNDFLLPLIIMRDQSRLPVMVQLLRMNGEYVQLWGQLMAGFALASVPVVILFACSMRLFTKGLTEGAVKG
jgi:ABC-type glycerol-3-phosphate transport system permease component